MKQAQAKSINSCKLVKGLYKLATIVVVSWLTQSWKNSTLLHALLPPWACVRFVALYLFINLIHIEKHTNLMIGYRNLIIICFIISHFYTPINSTELRESFFKKLFIRSITIIMFKYKIKRNPMVDLSKSNNTNANSFSVAASLTLEFTFILMFVQNFKYIQPLS